MQAQTAEISERVLYSLTVSGIKRLWSY